MAGREGVAPGLTFGQLVSSRNAFSRGLLARPERLDGDRRKVDPPAAGIGLQLPEADPAAFLEQLPTYEQGPGLEVDVFPLEAIYRFEPSCASSRKASARD